jgi:hypothetical protein
MLIEEKDKGVHLMLSKLLTVFVLSTLYSCGSINKCTSIANGVEREKCYKTTKRQNFWDEFRWKRFRDYR